LLHRCWWEYLNSNYRYLPTYVYLPPVFANKFAWEYTQYDKIMTKNISRLNGTRWCYFKLWWWPQTGRKYNIDWLVLKRFLGWHNIRCIPCADSIHRLPTNATILCFVHGMNSIDGGGGGLVREAAPMYLESSNFIILCVEILQQLKVKTSFLSIKSEIGYTRKVTYWSR
jgi:hypothetical protein